MGRIAEALKRADQERHVAAGAAVELPTDSLDREGADEAEALLDGCGSECVPVPGDEGPQQPIALVEGLSESLVPYYERSALVSEQYRALRTRLLSQNPRYEHRVLALTSAAPKEGKSVTTLNLACTLAEIRHLKLLVVDGDFRRSSLASMLNQPEGPGLADVLSGRADYEEAIHPTPIPNLFFIPAGNTDERSAAELLTAARSPQLFQRMRNDFHYTIVDTPPATTVTDVGIIGQMCYGVIMVVRINQTHEGVARQAVRLLQVNRIPIVGCVVIGRDTVTSRYGYGYGYYYSKYYNYYKEDRKEGRG